MPRRRRRAVGSGRGGGGTHAATCSPAHPARPPCPSALAAAKERVLARLREGRARGAAQVDVHRAFQRVQGRLSEARLSLRELKEEHKGRLRQYYARAVGASSSTASSSLGGSASAPAAAASGERAALAAEAAEADARFAAAALGRDGPLRVRGWARRERG